MGQTKENTDVVATEPSAGGGGGVSLGKGAWDCDSNVEIPPGAEVSLTRSFLPSTQNGRACAQHGVLMVDSAGCKTL